MSLQDQLPHKNSTALLKSVILASATVLRAAFCTWVFLGWSRE